MPAGNTIEQPIEAQPHITDEGILAALANAIGAVLLDAVYQIVQNEVKA